MNAIFKLMLLVVTSVLLLGGCTELAEMFFDGNPVSVSSCPDLSGGGPSPAPDNFLCVVCNSDTTEMASYDYCGAEISVRCNSDGPVVFGIAMGFYDNGPYGGPGPSNNMTAAAWIDDNDPGPSEFDEVVCHAQSIDFFGKHEYKCTTELTGNGKDGGITFEAKIKYDPAKDECI